MRDRLYNTNQLPLGAQCRLLLDGAETGLPPFCKDVGMGVIHYRRSLAGRAECTNFPTCSNQ